MLRFKWIMAVAILTLLSAILVNAQDMPTPRLTVRDQLVLDGFVAIDAVYSEGSSFVVIHRTSDGSAIGYASVAAGWTYNLRVAIDTTRSESKMSAMLHMDDHQVGAYEFGTVHDADMPVENGTQIVNAVFNAQVLDATDQHVVNNSVTIRAVAVPVNSWVVIYSDEAGTPGNILGETLVKAGATTNVKVVLTGLPTSSVWLMLNVDNHAAGTYEFGLVVGADAPVILNSTVAAFPIWTVNHLRVSDQIAIYGDNNPDAAMMNGIIPSVTLKSVLSDGPGILLIHANENGNSGTILGAVFLPDGLTENLKIDLNYTPNAIITPVVWPMLHMDKGTVGKGELNMDIVATADGKPVTLTIKVAPSITVSDQSLTESNVLTIQSAVIDAPGWIVIHNDLNGAPGPVIATAPLHSGANENIHITVDAVQAGSKVWPMLHYDTAAIGTYEFGSVKDADPPVIVQNRVVLVPLNLIN